jgi:hypothetical protein
MSGAGIPNPVTVPCVDAAAARALDKSLAAVHPGAPRRLCQDPPSVTLPGNDPGWLFRVLDYASDVQGWVTDEDAARAMSDMEAGLPKPEPSPDRPVVDVERVLEFFARPPKRKDPT